MFAEVQKCTSGDTAQCSDIVAQLLLPTRRSKFEWVPSNYEHGTGSRAVKRVWSPAGWYFVPSLCSARDQSTGAGGLLLCAVLRLFLGHVLTRNADRELPFMQSSLERCFVRSLDYIASAVGERPHQVRFFCRLDPTPETTHSNLASTHAL